MRPTEQPSSRSAALIADVRRDLLVGSRLAHGVGAAVVFGFLVLLLAESPAADLQRTVVVANTVGLALYLVFAEAAGSAIGRRSADPLVAWLQEERPATEPERQAALRYPMRLVRRSIAFWALAAIGFGGANLFVSVRVAGIVAVTVLLGGLTTCSLVYLLGERYVRPITARALAGSPPATGSGPGITTRLTVTWALTTAVPVVAAASVAMVTVDPSGRTAYALVLLLLFALVWGATGIWVAARAVADPIAAARDALTRIEAGDLDERVPVTDASEVGRLQAGINQLAAGLAERERLRDLFGRHVGTQVASEALAAGEVVLGGEEREAGIVFIDLVGSTSLTFRRGPREVVALLNQFFRIVVDEVESRGGIVDKFDGDGALCVFGAPRWHEDAAGAALETARALAQRVPREVPGADVGVGVSFGKVIAGNIGTERRLEYTVIGPPVNEAARLCALAKGDPARVLAARTAVEAATPTARQAWRALGEVVVRGLPSPVPVARCVATDVVTGRADGR